MSLAFFVSAAGGGVRLLWGSPACPLLLFLSALLGLGGEWEWGGFLFALFLLSLDLARTPALSIVQEVAAASAAAVSGFRIDVLTGSGGEFVALHALSLPLSILFVVLVLRAREGLRRLAPRPGPQTLIDLVLVGDALLFAAIFPHGASPAALLLPFFLLGGVLGEAVALWRGKPIASYHRAVAFGLALAAIHGAAKGPLSLSLVVPLALASVPLLTTCQAFAISGWGGERPRPLPTFLAARRHTPGSLAVLVLLLASGLGLGSALAAHHEGARAALAAAALPLVLLLHAARARILVWMGAEVVKGEGGRWWLFGVPLDPLRGGEALACLEKMVRRPGRSHVIVTPNSLSVLRSRVLPELAEAYRQADLAVADGTGVVWASRVLGSPLPERVTGIDLSRALLGRAAVEGWRVGLLGGREGVARRAAERLARQHVGLRVVFARPGYFAGGGPLDAIREARPDILLVGMGVPRQELWMTRNRDRLVVPILIGVGGALDVFAGDLRRAPHLWQRLGMEWLFRILLEPRRLQDALAIPRFLFEVLTARVGAALLAIGRLPDEA